MQLSCDAMEFPSHIDHIIYATGIPPKIENVACMQNVLNDHPVESINGLARITDDLMWNSEIPIFLTGGLAGLRLGPGAGNLAGARQGAERIAWKIDELFGKATTSSGTHGANKDKGDLAYERLQEGRAGDWSSSLVQDRSEFTGGFANQFEVLASCG